MEVTTIENSGAHAYGGPWGQTAMRITSARLAHGTLYKIYRCGRSFRAEIANVVPLLLRARAQVSIGNLPTDPALVITIDPLDSLLEEELICKVGRFLVAAT